MTKISGPRAGSVTSRATSTASALALALLFACSAQLEGSEAPTAAPATSPPTSTAAAATTSDIYLAQLDLSATPARLTGLRNLTNREGYDNQPHFVDETGELLYTSIRAGQADIYAHDFTAGNAALVHGDPANEYSPTIMPQGLGISMIREHGGVQKLWHYSREGEDLGPVLADVVDVGYHAWLSEDDVALFILDTEHERHRLEVINISAGTRQIVAQNIGRCLAVTPRASLASGVITFTILGEAEGPSTLMRYELETHTLSEVLKTRPGSQDYAWAPDGSLLMAQDAVIHRWTAEHGWAVLADLGDEDFGEITRLAVSGDGQRLALVGVPGANAVGDDE